MKMNIPKNVHCWQRRRYMFTGMPFKASYPVLSYFFSSVLSYWGSMESSIRPFWESVETKKNHTPHTQSQQTYLRLYASQYVPRSREIKNFRFKSPWRKMKMNIQKKCALLATTTLYVHRHDIQGILLTSFPRFSPTGGWSHRSGHSGAGICWIIHLQHIKMHHTPHIQT